jgi:hypothetical protein
VPPVYSSASIGLKEKAVLDKICAETAITRVELMNIAVQLLAFVIENELPGPKVKTAKLKEGKPSDHAVEVLSKLRAHCEEHEKLVLELLPAGRCRSVAITKLEEVSMWENKACVFELEQSEVQK